MSVQEASRLDLIRALNDEMRAALNRGDLRGHVLYTRGVQALPAEDRSNILTMVANHTDFSEGDDPWGEHDFGSFVYDEAQYFWKIDYYDTSLKYGSEDPSNPAITTRVLTIMLASEY